MLKYPIVVRLLDEHLLVETPPFDNVLLDLATTENGDTLAAYVAERQGMATLQLVIDDRLHMRLEVS